MENLGGCIIDFQGLLVAINRKQYHRVMLVIENASPPLQQTKDKNGVASYSCTD